MLSLCGVVVSLQQTILLPLLPQLPHLLETSADSASWLLTATLLTGAIATPTVSRLADMYGKRRMVTIALAVSVLGSLLGGLGQELPLLIAARALQGVGVAVVPVGIAIMRDELPRDRVPLGVAMMSGTLAIGAGAGLPLSGLISENLDWHACFWLTGAIIPESPVRSGGEFDIRGALVLSAALVAILVALTKGAQWGWTSPVTLGLMAGGLTLLAAWIPLELNTTQPVVDVRVAARRAVALVNLASVFAGFAMYVNMLVSMQFLQNRTASGYGLGLDMLDAGLWMVPSAVAFGLLAPVSAALTRRFGPQMTLITGASIMAVTYGLRIIYHHSLAQVVVGAVLVSVGTTLVYSALPTLIMRAVPVTETASANGLNVLLRSLGTSTSSAATAAITTAWPAALAGDPIPSVQSLDLMIALAAAAAGATALLGVPMLAMREYAAESDRSGAENTGAHTRVVRGVVLTSKAQPVKNAVVTVLTLSGEAVDWAQADTGGTFTVAIPDAGDYIVVTAADGWRPRSRVMHVDDTGALPAIALWDRMTLAGTITDAEDAPVADALVIFTRHSGEVMASLRTDHNGRYEMPRPPTGRYVLTVSAHEGRMGARSVMVLDTVTSADLVLGTPVGR